jgi:plastocyanin
MKKAYITIIVLIIAVAAVLFLVSSNKKVEAPTVTDKNADVTSPADTGLNAEVTLPPAATPKTSVKSDTTVTPPADKVTVKEFTVSGKNFSFTPSTLAVNTGDTVKITFKNMNGYHNFIIDEFKVNSGIVQEGGQQVVQFVADKAGSFQYYCSVGSHRAMGMWGTLTVK